MVRDTIGTPNCAALKLTVDMTSAASTAIARPPTARSAPRSAFDSIEILTVLPAADPIAWPTAMRVIATATTMINLTWGIGAS